MRYKIKLFFQRLFCKHDYITKKMMIVEAGRYKAYALECTKCGKHKIELH